MSKFKKWLIKKLGGILPEQSVHCVHDLTYKVMKPITLCSSMQFTFQELQLFFKDREIKTIDDVMKITQEEWVSLMNYQLDMNHKLFPTLMNFVRYEINEWCDGGTPRIRLNFYLNIYKE